MTIETLNRQHVITQEYIKILRDEIKSLKAENEMLKRQLYYYSDESEIAIKRIKQILQCEVQR